MESKSFVLPIMTNFSSELSPKLFKQELHCPFQRKIIENLNEIWRSLDCLGNREVDVAAYKPRACYYVTCHPCSYFQRKRWGFLISKEVVEEWFPHFRLLTLCHPREPTRYTLPETKIKVSNNNDHHHNSEHRGSYHLLNAPLWPCKVGMTITPIL